MSATGAPLEAEVVNGDIVHDAFTRLPIRCLECHADLKTGGHLGTCSHSVMRGGSPMPEVATQLVKCASCGWSEDGPSSNASWRGAHHLMLCPKRDDLRFVPWWTLLDDAFEVGWHTLDVNDPYEVPTFVWGSSTSSTYRVVPTRRFRFSEYADRVLIGVKS